MDEPSKASPSVNTWSEKAAAGVVKCCMMPAVAKADIDELDVVVLDVFQDFV